MMVLIKCSNCGEENQLAEAIFEVLLGVEDPEPDLKIIYVCPKCKGKDVTPVAMDEGLWEDYQRRMV